MPSNYENISAELVQTTIEKLIYKLINISDDNGEFFVEALDGSVIDSKGWNDWEWTQGVGLYGLLKYYDISGNDSAKDEIQKWFDIRLKEGTPSKNVNTMAPLLTMAYMYERTGDRQYLPYLDVWGEWLMNEMPRTDENGLQHIVFIAENNGHLWDDTLMMSVLPLAKIGLVLNRPHYVEEAHRQFLLHTKYLVDRKTGLWFHGWNFEGRHNFAEALWARGNSWITIAIPEYIELLNLSKSDGIGLFLTETLKSQVNALANLQHESGLWHTLLNEPDSYLESSASAGFAFGILKAVRMGLIDKSFEKVGVKAVKAVLADVSEEGELQQVSFGTPVFDDLQGYRDIPITPMPYGQSLALLSLVEFMYRYK